LYIVNILYIVTIKENYKKKIATAYSTNKEWKKKNSKLFINYFRDREQFFLNGTKKLFSQKLT
jgi:hypothetical protein